MVTVRRQLLTFGRHTAAAGTGYCRMLRNLRSFDLRRKKISANRELRRSVYNQYLEARREGLASEARFLQIISGDRIRPTCFAEGYADEFRVSSAREIDYILEDYPVGILISCFDHVPWRERKKIRLAAHARFFDYTSAGRIYGLARQGRAGGIGF
ncbi:uncharacterized protein LOC132298694 [Cornus florida]|uniref:uncharacterized protein LOC132298694 n=1 Tax=Cornus florida TaxID=4283 RepID=UPI00289DCD0F|nr:uncharacterized protein LOC132298694 [Cornus florida]